MGLLQCTRCGAHIISENIEKGRKLLDHSIGLIVGKPCEDGKAPLEFTGAKTQKEESKLIPVTKTVTNTNFKMKKQSSFL